jgi:hypothetical protein
MRNEVTEAVYIPQEKITEYIGNPLIEALPPIYSKKEVMKLITVEPLYNEGERDFEPHYRSHCIVRLLKYFQPLVTHVDIEGRISRAIRQGYVSKNPATRQYAEKLAQGAEAIKQKTNDLEAVYGTNSTGVGFTVIGLSGVGKTTSIERILSLYPQKILHTHYKGEPLFLTQLVWAKIDCPFDGSLKGLCMNFFSYVDRILGTSYSKKFLSERMAVHDALPKMAQIATLHCLGLLVVDEIQHLHQAKGTGSEMMLNFFVTLVNTIGVPVVLIGTTKALPILQSEFRQARRGSGQGDLLWDRMQNDLSWEIMLKSMWKYQWTKNHTPLSEELKNILYYESQGIIDIALKLYLMAQMKVIADESETITVKSIKEVAAEKLRLVQPALDALRSGDVKKMMMYDDIKPISIEDYFAAQLNRIVGANINPGTNEPIELEQQAVLKLLEMDIPSKIARSSVRKVIGKSNKGQPLSQVVLKSVKLALKSEFEKETQENIVNDDNDLRKASGESTYETLKSAGIIAESAEEF